MFDRWLRRALPTTSPLHHPVVLALLIALASATIVLAASALGHAALDSHLRPRFEGPGGYPRIQQHPAQYLWLSFHLGFFGCFFAGTAVRMYAAIGRATDAEARRAMFLDGWWLTLIFFLTLSGQYSIQRNLQVHGLYSVFVTSFIVLGLGARVLAWGIVHWVRHEAKRRSLDEWHRALRIVAVLLAALSALLFLLQLSAGPDANPVFERMVHHHLYEWGDGPLLIAVALLAALTFPSEFVRLAAARRLRAIRAGTDPEFTLRPLHEDETPPAALPTGAAKGVLGIVRRRDDQYRQASSEGAIASV